MSQYRIKSVQEISKVYNMPGFIFNSNYFQPTLAIVKKEWTIKFSILMSKS